MSIYSHWRRVCGILGLFVGRPGQEIQVVEADGKFPRRWKDIIVASESLGSAASAPDNVTITGGILGKGFDGNATTEQLYGTFELQHDYKEGTNVRPHIHWCPSSNSAGNVKWQMEYALTNFDEVFAATTTISVTDSSELTQNKHLKVELPVITGTTLRVGSIIKFRLFRNPQDAADTYPDDAILLDAGLHYEVNAIGSSGIFGNT